MRAGRDDFPIVRYPAGAMGFGSAHAAGAPRVTTASILAPLLIFTEGNEGNRAISVKRTSSSNAPTSDGGRLTIFLGDRLIPLGGQWSR